MNVRRSILAALLLTAAAWGCQRDPARCVPGLHVRCACADATGRFSAQVCTPGGTFGPCACPAPPAAALATPALVDASPAVADASLVVVAAPPTVVATPPTDVAVTRATRPARAARPASVVSTEGGVRTALVCGHLGFRCCSDGLCVGWSRCSAGLCEACGQPGGACCGARCQGAGQCVEGQCLAGSRVHLPPP